MSGFERRLNTLMHLCLELIICVDENVFNKDAIAVLTICLGDFIEGTVYSKVSIERPLLSLKNIGLTKVVTLPRCTKTGIPVSECIVLKQGVVFNVRFYMSLR